VAPRLGLERRADPIPAPSLDFATVYNDWVHQVSRWVRALGGLELDVEDVAQEVFVVVRRKLPAFDGNNLAGWLYKITEYSVREYKRRSWFRNLLHRRDEGALRDLPDPREGVALVEHKQEMRLVARVLERMNETRRATFVLFEIEGYSGEEIAQLHDVPVATVWTRLHYARKEFFALMAEAQTKGTTR
jgi:RNA polymerase sigma-70 factor (ECF subfamily)